MSATPRSASLSLLLYNSTNRAITPSRVHSGGSPVASTTNRTPCEDTVDRPRTDSALPKSRPWPRQSRFTNLVPPCRSEARRRSVRRDRSPALGRTNEHYRRWNARVTAALREL